MVRNTTERRVQVHAHVERGVRDELLAVARANDRSLAAEIRCAIDEHVRHAAADTEKRER